MIGRLPLNPKFFYCLKMTYKEKLLDPRWQKKRLEILTRDLFECRLCHDKTTTLHIHHFCYSCTFNPWDVEDEALITYCKHCHSLIEYNKKSSKHPYHIIKLEITKGITALAVYYLCENNIFNLFYYYEKTEFLSYITTLPCDFIESIHNHFTFINKLLNG